MANFGVSLLVLCAVLSLHVRGAWQKRVRPAKQDAAKIPDNLLGVFSNDNDKLNHVTALWFALHDAPFMLNVSLVKGNTIEFKRWEPSIYDRPQRMLDFDYQYCFNLGESMDSMYKRCVPFRLNKIAIFPAGKDAHQVMFTLVEGSVRAAVQSPREWGFRKTLMTFVPREAGIAVSFNGDPAALYTPALPEYMFGAWQLDANNTLIEAANAVFQSFVGTTSHTLWTNLTSLWISRTSIHRDDEFLFKIAFSRNNVMHRDYRLVNGTLVEFSKAYNERRGFRRSAEQPTLHKNAIVQKIQLGSKDSLTFRHTFYQDYMLQTVELNNNISVVLTYNRTVPWHFYGTYEEIKETATEQVRLDMTTSGVPSEEQCNTTRRIRIYPDRVIPSIVLEKAGCTSRTFRFRLNKDEEEMKNVTDGDKTLLLRTITQGLLNPGSREMVQVRAQTSSARYFEDIWIGMVVDPYDFGLDMTYRTTTTNYHSSENYGPREQESIISIRFRKIVAPSVYGKYEAAGPETTRDAMFQIIQGLEDQFQYNMLSSDSPDPVLHNMTFNTAAEIQPGIQSMWHYVEVFDTVILTTYQTIHPDSSDFAKTQAFVVSPDGITMTDYRFGTEHEVNLSRAV